MVQNTKLLNFGKALRRLETFCSEPIQNDRDEAGIIQAFEFTYELSWKALKALLEIEGITANSPRQAFTQAIQTQLIESSDEAGWLQMIHDRNFTSHTYREEFAHEVTQRIIQSHLPLFQKCFKRCEETELKQQTS